jgi:hypothetical protein
VNAVELLPAVRDLYSKLPEMRYLQAWELQSALFVLGYTDKLEDEDSIAARMDWDPEPKDQKRIKNFDPEDPRRAA